MKGLLLFLACCSGIACGQCTITVTSPTAGATVSGRVNLTPALATCPSVYDVTPVVDGVVQGTAYAQQAFTMPNWNSNNRHNGLTHFIYFVGYDATQTVVAQSPTVYFSIANNPDYGDARTFLYGSAISFTTASGTASTPPSSAYGVIGITVTMAGTALGTNNVITSVNMDGDGTTGVGLLPYPSNGATQEVSVNTANYEDGNHYLCMEIRDWGTNNPGSGTNNTPGTFGGYPVEEDCIYFSTHNQVSMQKLATLTTYDTSASTLATFTSTSLNHPGTTLNIPAGALARVCTTSAGSTTSTTITNSVGDTFTPEGTPQTVQGLWYTYCAHTFSTGGSAVTFTATTNASATNNPQMIVEVWSGVGSVESVAQSAGTTGSGVVSQASGSFNTTNSNDVIDGIYVQALPATVFQAPLWNLGAHATGTSAALMMSETQQVIGTVSGAVQTVYFNQLSGVGYGFTIAILVPSGSLVTAPMRVTVSPQNWSITDTGTQQLTPGIINCDTTTSALPTGMQVTYSTTSASSIATVSSAGLVTPNATGFGWFNFNATLGNGLAKEFPNFGRVQSTNAVYHFVMNPNGAISANPTANDVNEVLQFLGGYQFSDPMHTQAQWGIPYSLVMNTWETQMLNGVWPGSQPALTSALNSTTSTANTLATTYNLHIKVVNTSWWENGQLMYAGNPGGAFTSDPWLQNAQAWAATGKLINATGPDESDGPMSNPIGEQRIGHLDGPSTINCPGGSPNTCTLTYDTTGLPFSGAPAVNANCGGYGGFTIDDSGGMYASELATTYGTSSFYNIASRSGNTITFTIPSTSAVAASMSTDPNLIVQYVAGSYGPVATGPISNCTTAATPANTYSPWNAGQMVSSDWHTGGLILAGETKAIADPYSTYFWESTKAGFADFAQTYAQNGYTPATSNQQGATNNDAQIQLLSDLRSQGSQLHTVYNYLGGGQAQVHGNVSGTATNYAYTGQNFAITSISGPVVQFASAVCGPTALRQSCTTYASISRGTISGVTGTAAYNTNVWVVTLPTNSSAYIAFENPTATPSAASTAGTITMADGTPFTGVTMNAESGSCTAKGCYMTASNASTINLHWGQTFTFAGAGSDPYYTSHHFLLKPCVAAGSPSGSGVSFYCNTSQLYFWEVPDAGDAATGGNMNLIMDAWFTPGINQTSWESRLGPFNSGAQVWNDAVDGMAGESVYVGGPDYNTRVGTGTDAPCWNPSCPAASAAVVQPGNDPLADNGETGAVGMFYGIAGYQRVLSKLAEEQVLFGGMVGATDQGYLTEASLRTGTAGKVLLVSNTQDTSYTFPLDASGCNTYGGGAALYVIDPFGVQITSVATGVTSIPVTLTKGGGAALYCPSSGSAFTPVTFSAKLSDVANAASIVVQYDVTPFHLQQTEYPQWGPPPGTSIGTGSATVNLDLAMGPWFYRLVYLNASGTALATGAIQCLGGTTAACPAGY